ncbi:MAG: arginase family protein [Ignavibacteriales bacterium]|nr:arginase family protein [Ignavibacteriales bacterium]
MTGPQINKNSFFGLQNDYDKSEIVVLPVSCGSSAAKQIINASLQLESFDEEIRIDISAAAGIFTSNLIIKGKKNDEQFVDAITKEINKHTANDKFVVTIGDSRYISAAPIFSFLKKYNDLSVLQFDAHSCLKQIDKPNYAHQNTARHIIERTKKIVQIGVRSQGKDENEFRLQKQIRIFYTREIKLGMYGDNWHELINQCLSDHVYITFDLDVFDTSIIPNVELPEPGGLFWDETLNLLKLIGLEKKVVGFDIVGLVPSKNYIQSNYIAAKLIYKILNYSFVD